MGTVQDTIVGGWRNLDRGFKIALFVAAVLAVAAIIWGIFVLAREDYRTLFSQLSDTDAAAIVAELKRQKIPYKLSDGGSTVSVPTEQVHDTRLGLMSTNVPLSGGVGFEIFDKQGLGTTEQSQRVSFQRALQGELARTIAVLDNVKQARVHLVLPESSLFKRDHQEATAAVTVTMKPGNTLERQQILGVQRLVAASVSGLDPARVVITDQRGVTLSSAEATGGAAGSVAARLDVQRQVEAHLAQKIARMLDGAVGPGQAMVSVDVALRFDAIKTTTQDLLPLYGASGPQANAVVRRRQVTTGEGSNALSGDVIETAATGRRSGSTTEVEYEYGRRVEEVIAAPGAIRRVTVGVIVPPHIDQEQQQRIRELVRVAAGIDDARGDLLSVQALGQPLLPAPEASAVTDADASGASASVAGGIGATRNTVWSWPRKIQTSLLAVLIACVVFGVFAIVLVRPWRSRSLSDRQREALLDEIRRTLGEESRASQLKAKQ